ncbi:MAG: hypothetical protein Q7S51_08505 [Gallionellaceae bacterium]|nr:hypothetical protein [Gallionellaceae bacterium]
MADLKSAQQLLKDVPRNDALKALQEITDWIESVRDNADFHVDQRLDVLSLLDESARTHMRKLVYDYFSAQSLSQFQENRTWMTLNQFFSHTAQAYYKILSDYRSGNKGSSAIKSSLPLVAARGIYASMGRLKLAAARYTPVEQILWQQMAEFYSHAEAQQYLNTPLILYPGTIKETSVRNKFTSMLIWYAAGSSTLSPRNMHLAERLTTHFAKHLTVANQITPDSLFYFDLAHPTPPIKITSETLSDAGRRFIGVGEVIPHIEALLKILEKNIVPEEVNLGGLYAPSTVRDVACYLAGHLTSPPPMRRNIRRQIKVNMNVVHGFSNIAEPANNMSGMTWEAEDISATGFRCVLPASNAEGIRIGSVIGIKPENVPHRGVGIVRRLNRDGLSNLHVGVEMLSKQVDTVSLHVQGSYAMATEQIALWLKKMEEDSSEVQLLMNADTFSMSRSLNTEFDGKGYLLIPVALLEKGVDYDLGRYRKVEEDSADY